MAQEPEHPRERLRHVIGDESSRGKKARKIEEILMRRRPLEGLTMLDVGAGSGHLARYSREQGLEVVAVDRQKPPAWDESIDFRVSDGTRLPFEPSRFDLVIYNHVIEHVGQTNDQLAHLREIRRVLRRSGLLYLAVPNRWAVVENHYRLPFLSWLPPKAANAYVRITGRGAWYDCTPLSAKRALGLFQSAGFSVEDITYEVAELFVKGELRDNFWSKPIHIYFSCIFNLIKPSHPDSCISGTAPLIQSFTQNAPH